MHTTQELHVQVEQVVQSLLRNSRQDDYAGYDPFDGCNSRLFTALGLQRWRLARLAWLQFHKRFPWNLRPLVGVPKKRNPKGVGLMVLGLLHQHRRTGDDALLQEARDLGRWLLEARVDRQAWGGSAWGYHFPWQARAFFVPLGTPNSISTVYVSLALRELAKVVGDERFLQAADEAGVFIAERLFAPRSQAGFFRYIPGEDVLVHNANLWGAATVAMSGVSLGRRELLDKAAAAAQLSVDSQREDGAWPYGERHHHQFVDGFHTGYNIEALLRLHRALDATPHALALEKGLAYYTRNFFLADGTPKYYDTNPYPIEMHNTAQAVITLLQHSTRQQHMDLVRRVIAWSIGNMYNAGTGCFHYRKWRHFTVKTNYFRWVQAWMFYALNVYLEAVADHVHSRPTE